jgi:dTDP-4-amino-4,6-dideoxygalactose transaminase
VRRRRNGQRLHDALIDHPLIIETPVDDQERQNAFWWAPYVVDTSRLGVSINAFAAAMAAEGVPIYTVQWPEMYCEEIYTKRRGFGRLNYPFDDPSAPRVDYTRVNCATAHWLSGRTLSFFMHPVYSDHHIDLYAEAFHKVAEALSPPDGREEDLHGDFKGEPHYHPGL